MNLDQKLRLRQSQRRLEAGSPSPAAAPSILQQQLADAQARDRQVERTFLGEAERTIAAAEALETAELQKREARRSGRLLRAESNAKKSLDAIPPPLSSSSSVSNVMLGHGLIKLGQEPSTVTTTTTTTTTTTSSSSTSEAQSGLTSDVSPETLQNDESTLAAASGSREQLLEEEVERIKGVCVGPVYLENLFTAELKRKVAASGELDVEMRFDDIIRDADLRRLASELSRGVYVHGAVPWLSLESVNDRGAARLSTMHPCYRDTLVGMTCLELDVALKAVAGSAHGGVFCDASQRQDFLNKVCRQESWGPNGQKELPEGLRTLQEISEEYPSFQTSTELFGSEEVLEWKEKWTEKGDSGADIKASLDHLIVHEHDNKVILEPRASWSVELHSEEQVCDAAREGEAMCARLLPSMPVPLTCEGDWRPPEGANRLEYLFALLKAAAALTSALSTAKTDLGLWPNDALADASWPTCRTPRWLPFEPALDVASSAVFLGGGVGLRPVDKGCVTHTSSTASRSSSMLLIKLRRRQQQPPRDDERTALFLHEVAALGLASNYASVHPHLEEEVLNQAVSLSAESIATLLKEILPEEFCRRLRMSSRDVACKILQREDAVLLLGQTGELAHSEKVTFFNGDVYDGKWRCGRRHGEGTYTFNTGSCFQGRWDDGEMTGVGWYTTTDGNRKLVDLRQRKTSPCSSAPRLSDS